MDKVTFWTRKKLIWTGAIVLVLLFVGYLAFGRGGSASTIQTATAATQNIQETVLATGQVVSNVDLNLSFQGSGVVTQVYVQEGQAVSKGQTLAVLDQTSARAALTTAQGSLAQAKANYDKVAAGATSASVQVSQAAVAAAQTTVANAYSTLLSSGLAAIPPTTNSSTGSITVTGVYNATTTGSDTVSISGTNFNLAGMDAGYTQITRGVPIPIGTHGLYLTFSSTGTFNSNDSWTINVPNTQSSTYLANYNAYQSALSALAQAQASLALTEQPATPQDLEVAQAAVLSAQGQVSSAQAALDNTILSAPAGGTITEVDTKVGEQASTLQEVMILQDVKDLHAEADVSEANIASINPGQSVSYTFDALGPNETFNGSVESVNPASVVLSGIVDYKVTANIQNAPDIKPGMTANMTILVAQVSNALVVPANAIINQGSDTYVRVVDDAKKGTYHQVQVKTGLNADGGLVQILSGLSAGQMVVTSVQ